MNSQDLTIGILSTTAVVLLVGLLAVSTSPKPALGSGMTEGSGRYVITVGTVSLNDEEAVFLLDNQDQRLIVYRFDTGTRQLIVNQRISLEELTKAADSQSGTDRNRGAPRSGKRKP